MAWLHDIEYEVEFSHPDGSTIAWFAVPAEDLELIEDVPMAEPLRPSG
jgi:hypothetical protein